MCCLLTLHSSSSSQEDASSAKDSKKAKSAAAAASDPTPEFSFGKIEVDDGGLSGGEESRSAVARQLWEGFTGRTCSTAGHMLRKRKTRVQRHVVVPRIILCQLLPSDQCFTWGLYVVCCLVDFDLCCMHHQLAANATLVYISDHGMMSPPGEPGLMQIHPPSWLSVALIQQQGSSSQSPQLLFK